ncbi:cytochrome c3 family protein [Paraferrimonas sedimenticola]|uniref:Cytochrome c n=1 Tax=Paraferrimonas sedimenticola TaxID=375674 RepID=A0AA37VXC7_9GAMM|nr:cytochrome c3 family protein [Paraferrimonas sedimenticola]GLP96656.1 cytochrome c [Paraferrimonas sedimenticola]
MSKLTFAALFAALLAVLAFAPLTDAADQSIADMHADANGCESCHADGEPSADGAHENAMCVECHGGMADMDEPHPTHEDAVVCSDCHQVHDMNVGQVPTFEGNPKCADCHG